MEYIIGFVFLITICVAIFWRKSKTRTSTEEAINMQPLEFQPPTMEACQHSANQLMVRLEQLSLEEFKEDDKLIEIKDEGLLARIDNLVPELLQVGNAANKVYSRNIAHLTSVSYNLFRNNSFCQ